MPTSLEKKFVKHYDEWCLLSFSYVKNMKDAEEIVQDIVVTILLKERQNKISNLKAYMATAIKNRSLKQIKNVRRFEPLSPKTIPTSPSYEDTTISKESEEFLRRAIDSLPPSSKRVFNLCVVEKQQYKSVAETQGISVNTVKYHVKKAYKLLRTEVDKSYIKSLLLYFSLFF